MVQTVKKPRIIMHLDMDAFFAAVEQLDHPEYRGKPVVVGADPKGGFGRGVVSTASYEARVFGIHSAMPISQAFRRCPEAIFVRGRYARYHELSEQVMGILRTYTPTIQQISIDEAFLDFSRMLVRFEEAIHLAVQLKAEIKSAVGLSASIGVAGNKFVAKVASDLQKPDGLTVCPPGQEKRFLAPLPIRKLWGVGEKTAQSLNDRGFKLIGDLAAIPMEKAATMMGRWGLHLWKLANGIDNRPVESFGRRKSISEEITFEHDVDDHEYIEQMLFQIADRLARTMRRKHLKGRTVTLKLRFAGFETHTRSRTLPDFVDDTESLRSIAVAHFRKFASVEKKVRLVGIGVSQLNTRGGEQLNLFSSESSRQRQKVDQLVDEMRKRHGEGSIMRASFLERPPAKKPGSRRDI